MFEVKRTEDEIENQMHDATDASMSSSTRWPGMTYEQGVANALRWVLGEDDTAPMEDE